MLFSELKNIHCFLNSLLIRSQPVFPIFYRKAEWQAKKVTLILTFQGFLTNPVLHLPLFRLLTSENKSLHIPEHSHKNV